MTLTLELPAELEAELSAEAARLGLTLPEYALRVLASTGQPGAQPSTGADIVAYWQALGLLGTRPDIADSQRHARHLRRQAEHRPRG